MRGTSLATIIQGIVITAGCVMLFIGTVHSAGGFPRSTEILAALGCGMVVYALANTVCPRLRLWGTHPSLVAVTAAVIAFIVVSLLSSQPAEDIVQTFWGKRVS